MTMRMDFAGSAAGRWLRVLAGTAALTMLSVGFASAAVPCTGKPMLGQPEALLQTAGKVARHDALKILAIGSSSTWGAGASGPSFAYPARLQDKMNAALGADKVSVLNAGIGGETAVETLARLKKLVGDTRYDLVIWQAGTNDAVKGGDEAIFRSLMNEGIRAVTETGSDLMLLDQQFFPKVKDPERYERFVAALDDVGVENGLAVFQRYAAMRDWAARDPAGFPSMLSGDGFHMSDAGYECLATLVGDQLLSLRTPPNVARAAKVSARPASQSSAMTMSSSPSMLPAR